MRNILCGKLNNGVVLVDTVLLDAAILSEKDAARLIMTDPDAICLEDDLRRDFRQRFYLSDFSEHFWFDYDGNIQLHIDGRIYYFEFIDIAFYSKCVNYNFELEYEYAGHANGLWTQHLSAYLICCFRFDTIWYVWLESTYAVGTERDKSYYLFSKSLDDKVFKLERISKTIMG